MQATIRIKRFNPSTQQIENSEHIVEAEPGWKVLDALRTIQATVDPTLNFRWECRSGICGACALMINGQPRLSCEAIVEPGSVVEIAPLPGFPVLVDLIVDISPSLLRLEQALPYLIQGTEETQRITKAQADASKSYRRCIECFACVAAITDERHGYESDSVDPLGIVKLARFATDPRDKENRRLLAQKAGVQRYSASTLHRAGSVCPKHIDIVAAREVLVGPEDGFDSLGQEGLKQE